MEKLLVLCLSGLTNGSVYGLVGLSIALIYASTRVINFAQGDFVMLGAMIIASLLENQVLGPVLAILAVLGISAISALLLEALAYSPLVRRTDPLNLMLGTFAGSVIIGGVALLIWGPNQIYVPGVFSMEPVRIGVITTTAQQISIVASFVVSLLVAWWILYMTNFGLTVRATGINASITSLMGIRANRIIRFTFIFSACVSAASGVLVGPLLGGQVSMGLGLTVKGFMAAILGGLGNPFAAAAGGLMIGVLEAMVGGYGSSLYAEPVIFALILIVLLIRPYGLLGEFEAVQR
ncbi:MAG: branched-chain amino acid ABC transporter permease [Acetobacteraceae bacterium]